MTRTTQALALVVLTCLIATMSAILLIVRTTTGIATVPNCQTDESGPEFPTCYWDAEHQGDGQGRSMILNPGNTIEVDQGTQGTTQG